MDLHAWITQQVDAVEEAARGATKGPWWTERPAAAWGEEKDPALVSSHGHIATFAVDENGGLNALHVERHDPATVLRRCEADRRILDRHRIDPDVTYEPACKGCGTYSDMDLSNVDNLNDCPELLDLANAHGITPEILASLDRPQPPEPRPRDGRRLGLADILATPPITTSDVPAALRGPRWKP